MRRGFTLIELTMVIVTIGALVAIAVPKYTSALARYRANSAAMKLAGDLTLAKARARAMSTSVAISFSNNTYTISGMTDPEHPSNTYTVDLSADPFKATISSCTFSNNSTLTFNGYGNPNGSGAVTLQVGAITKTVSVDTDSGVTSIQ